MKYLDKSPHKVMAYKEFFIDGGYKEALAESYLMITGYGVNAFDRWADLQIIGVMRDIDFLCSISGLDFIPQPLNYWFMSLLFILVVGGFYWKCFECLGREDDTELPFMEYEAPSRKTKK